MRAILVFLLVLCSCAAQAQDDCPRPYLATDGHGCYWVTCSEPAPRAIVVLHQVGRVLVGAANGADLASTIRGLDRGAHEANPLLLPLEQHPLYLGAAKVGEGVLTINLLDRVFRSHPRMAVLLDYSIVGLYTGVAIRNERVR